MPCAIDAIAAARHDYLPLLAYDTPRAAAALF